MHCKGCKNPLPKKADSLRFCVYCGKPIGRVPGWIKVGSPLAFVALVAVLLVSYWPMHPSPSAKPDFAIADMIWSPAEPAVGEAVTFTATVECQGAASSETSSVQFYIDNGQESPQSLGAMGAGDSAQVVVTWTAKEGTHVIRVVADSMNAIAESNEANNEDQVTFSIPPAPDLVVRDVAWSPTSASEADTVTFTITVKNQGNAIAGPSSVSIDVDGTEAGIVPVAELGYGDTATADFTWSGEGGNHTILAVADCDDSVSEGNETNNEVEISIVVSSASAAPGPDLVISSIAWTPENPSVGETVRFNLGIRNTGDADAAAFGINVLVDGAEVDRITLGSVAAGSTAAVSFEWVAEEGQHVIKAIADCDRSVSERNETNNEKQVVFSSAEAWRRVDVGTTDFGDGIYGVALGTAQNDGIRHVYVAGEGGMVKRVCEFSYSAGNWSMVTLPDTVWGYDPAFCVTTGQARYDGVERVYTAVDDYNTGTIMEYTYSAGAWAANHAHLSGDCQYTNIYALAIGAARNDGVNRLYVAHGKTTSGGIVEISYSSGAWCCQTVVSSGVHMWDVVVAQGRNDGVMRVYGAGNDGHIYECTFSGGTWAQVDLGGVSSPMKTVTVGDGRNDGHSHVYGAGDDGHVYEFTFTGSQWEMKDIGYGGGGMKCVTIGAGRNDGISRVYAGNADGHIYEFTYNGETWVKEDVGKGGSAMQSVAIGDGRNDGVARLYGGNEDGHVYEFSAPMS